MEQYLSMGLNIALLVFITFGFLGGIIRGLKKTAFRGLFLIITVIIALFITMPVTNLLLGIQIDTTLNIGSTNIRSKSPLYPNGAYPYTPAGIIRTLIYSFIPDRVHSEPHFCVFTLQL